MHCHVASTHLTACDARHLRRLLPRTWHSLCSTSSFPAMEKLRVLVLSSAQMCCGCFYRRHQHCLYPYSCYFLLHGDVPIGFPTYPCPLLPKRYYWVSPTVPEKALGRFYRRELRWSQKGRLYLREMGYKVNRDDDNGDGATNTRDLTLNIPRFWAFTQKIRVSFTVVVAETIASEMRISSELSDDYD